MNKHTRRAYQSSKDTLDRKRLKEVIHDIFIGLAWTIAFWIEVGKTNETSCQGPAYSWATYSKIYYLIGLITCFLLVPMMLIWRSRVMCLVDGICFILVLAGIPNMIGMVISFANIDQCPDLKGIVTAQFVIVMILCGLLILLSCCSVIECFLKSNRCSQMLKSFVNRLIGIRIFQQPPQSDEREYELPNRENEDNAV